jgi:hypothetical protein
MTLHAIQNGSVRIKTAQVQGRGRGLSRRLRIFADRDWTEWLPTYVWLIDHSEGGQRTALTHHPPIFRRTSGTPGSPHGASFRGN